MLQKTKVKPQAQCTCDDYLGDENNAAQYNFHGESRLH
jgi:hypothetical protein